LRRTLILFVLAALSSACTHQIREATATDGKELPWLKVEGNRIVDRGGETVVLKGLCICNPPQLQWGGRWNAEYFGIMASWGARIVRIPIGPIDWRQRGSEAVFKTIDEAVEWSKPHGMYVIIDWHSIGDPVKGKFQEPWAENFRTDEKEMTEFWTAAALRYKEEPTVAFYEIFNEPAGLEYTGNRLEWAEWKPMAERLVKVVRKANPRAIPIVGGVRWSYNLKDIGADPIKDPNVVYAVHVYPGHAPQPWEENWEKSFGYLAAKHPLMLTEFGYDPDDKIMPGTYRGDDEFGRRITDFAAKKGMSWTAFVFCDLPGWPMPLFKGWEDYTPTMSGAFFKGRMKE